jgi:hypothetical protein
MMWGEFWGPARKEWAMNPRSILEHLATAIAVDGGKTALTWALPNLSQWWPVAAMVMPIGALSAGYFHHWFAVPNDLLYVLWGDGTITVERRRRCRVRETPNGAEVRISHTGDDPLSFQPLRVVKGAQNGVVLLATRNGVAYIVSFRQSAVDADDELPAGHYDVEVRTSKFRDARLLSVIISAGLPPAWDTTPISKAQAQN